MAPLRGGAYRGTNPPPPPEGGLLLPPVKLSPLVTVWELDLMPSLVSSFFWWRAWLSSQPLLTSGSWLGLLRRDSGSSCSSSLTRIRRSLRWAPKSSAAAPSAAAPKPARGQPPAGEPCELDRGVGT